MFSRYSLAGLALLGVMGCSDSTGPSSALTLAKIAGTWDLNRSEMLLATDTSVSADNSNGIEASLSITRNGMATLQVIYGGDSITVGGTIALRGDTVFYDAEGSGSTYAAIVKLAGRTMTWLSVETVLYDMDGDGTPEDAYERDVWQRRSL